MLRDKSIASGLCLFPDNRQFTDCAVLHCARAADQIDRFETIKTEYTGRSKPRNQVAAATEPDRTPRCELSSFSLRKLSESRKTRGISRTCVCILLRCCSRREDRILTVHSVGKQPQSKRMYAYPAQSVTVKCLQTKHEYFPQIRNVDWEELHVFPNFGKMTMVRCSV